jgi:glycosyltransferase involved in cell wall biosynthesis
VLHLRDSPWVDGPGRTILETGAHLDPKRVEFHIGALVPPRENVHPLAEAARARNIDIVEFRDTGGIPPSLIDEIVKIIDMYDINVLHSSEFRSRLIARICTMRRRRVHHVTTAHGWVANTLGRKLARFADKALLRTAERVILVSHAMRRLVPEWWLPVDRTVVLHNALVLHKYGAEVLARPRRPVDSRAGVTLLNVGRLSLEKGQDMLIRAVHRLLPRWPALRLRIAGIGPLEAELRSLAKQLGIESQVEFVGYVEDMPTLYYDTDLVVQSSYTEGLPNVVLESAFLKAPIVATAVGGTDEVVRHGESGWLIRANLDELTDGIERFLMNPDEFVRMAEKAHEHVMANFSFDARTQRLTEMYEALLGIKA